MPNENRPAKTYNVLCVDGGGMRGIYSAAYLEALTTRYAAQRDIQRIDLGKAFDLICGTSTGAIVACAIAKDTQLSKVIALYKEKGRQIFPMKVPSNALWVFFQAFFRSSLNACGAKALEAALHGELGETRIIDIWKNRGIALAFPAVEMSRHRSWVFKTPHLPNSKDRDGKYRLVDVCLATSAAPVFRSMAWLPNPDTVGGLAFVDGGLWANNPVLVGLIDALEMTREGDHIHIFCLGTCPPPSGDQLSKTEMDRGFGAWRFGADVPNVSIAAQQFAYDNMARMLGKHVGREVKIIRFPAGDIPATMMGYLDLDETTEKAMDALITLGQTDANNALSVAGSGTDEGNIIDRLFRTAPESERKE